MEEFTPKKIMGEVQARNLSEWERILTITSFPILLPLVLVYLIYEAISLITLGCLWLWKPFTNKEKPL